MKLRRSLVPASLVLLAGTLFTTEVSAGGSVAYEEVRGLIPEPARAHLEQAYSVADVGGALRLGRHFTHLGGARMGPYQFDATSKRSPNLVFELTVNTRVTFVDAAGNETAEPESAQKIREVFESYTLVLGAPVDGATAAPGGKPMPALIPVPVPVATPVAKPVPVAGAPLDQAGRERVVAAVRANYGDVENTDMEFDGGMMEERDGLSGNVTRGYSRNGAVRRLEFEIGAGDHGGFKLEMMCDGESRPSFVLWQAFHWGFKPGNSGETVDHVREWRYYFAPDGQLAKGLVKEYSGSGEEQLMQRRDTARNRDFIARQQGVSGFHAALARLVACPDAELDELAEKLIASHDVMLGQ